MKRFMFGNALIYLVFRSLNCTFDIRFVKLKYLVMKRIYKAHLLFTKERSRFEVLENSYIAVENGCIVGVASDLSSLDYKSAEITDFGDCLLIPAMNDLHVHAPQYRNQGMAMDLELLPWLQNYTFPEEMKYADLHYADSLVC